MSIFDELAEVHPTSIILTGGEPLLRDDLIALLRRISAFCKSVSIETNGILLDRHIDGLCDLRESSRLAVSLDAWRPETAAALQGHQNIKVVLRNMEAAARRGLRVQIITVLTKENIGEVPEIYAFASDVGATLRLLPSISCGGRGRYSQEHNVDPAGILAFARSFVFPRMPARAATPKSAPSIHIHLPLPFLPFEVPPYNMTCMRQKFAIFPNGDVAFCYRALGLPSLLLGSLRDTRLQAILAQPRYSEALAYPPQSEFQGVCSRCVAFRVCHGSCPLDRFWLSRSFTSSYHFCQTLYEQGLFPEYAITPNAA